ncbi:MAG TPA: acetylxylan esterase [Spirochaetia bacterium]|nr:acetylxylan esterase [Spirochaetia bacterium]
MLFDLPLAELKKYRPERNEPADFDSFWSGTLQDARAAAHEPVLVPIDPGVKLMTVHDVTFSGYAGQPIKAWLLRPRNASGSLPCVVEYIGYGGGRALPTERLLWSAAGYAHFIMDTRGQGSSWCTGDTPDPETEPGNPHHPGFMTRGVLKPETYYYRRVLTDAVRAYETVRTLPGIDPDRIALTGASQGGGIVIAVSGLARGIAAALPDVPFLCHIRTATEITDAYPYQEIVLYCRMHKDKVEEVFRTLEYFDGVHFAARAGCPALFSAGLMDDVCPPRTVFAAYNHWAGPKRITTWPYNRHEGGGPYQDAAKLTYLNELWS